MGVFLEREKKWGGKKIGEKEKKKFFFLLGMLKREKLEFRERIVKIRLLSREEEEELVILIGVY